MQDQFNEIPIVIITLIVMFLLLTIIVVTFLIRYQRRKYLYQQHLLLIQKENAEAILKSQLEIQEQTFNAISEEIHDNVGQILSLAKVQLNIVEEQLPTMPTLLIAAKENISRAMSDLRDVAKSLSTERIVNLNLVSAITHEIERLNNTTTLSAQFIITGTEKKIDSKKRLVVFRIVQEALNNILKHAHANIIIITLTYDEQQLSICLQDDGIGFEMQTTTHKGLGLQNIIKRTALIGGKASINSTPHKGTTITLNIPYD